MERYQKHISLPGFGLEGQEILRNTSVLIIGAGGLGVPVMQQLTACGVGTIGILDGDSIDISNLHRQLLYTEQDVGKSKVEVAAQKLQQMNSEVSIKKYPFFLKAENALEIFPHYDVIVDATDRFDARYLINDVCVLLQKVWVYGAVFQWEGQWAVWNFSVNRSVKTTYRDLFPKPPKATMIPDCNAQGVFATVPVITGYFMANELIKMLIYPNEISLNVLSYHNFLKNKSHTLTIVPRTDFKEAPSSSKEILDFDYSYYCGYESKIEKQKGGQEQFEKDVLIVDVRQPEEFPKLPVKCLQIPLAELPQRIHELNTKKVLFVCQSGIRSKKAYELCKTLLPETQLDYFADHVEQFIKKYQHA